MQGSLEETRTSVAERNAAFTSAKEAHVAAQQSLSTAEELQQTLLTGLSSSSNTSAGGYLGGIADARARAAAAGTEAEQAKVQLTMAQAEIKEKESRARKMESEGQKGKETLEKGRKEVAELNAKLEQCGWSREMKEELDGKMRGAREMMSKTRDVSWTLLERAFDILNFCPRILSESVIACPTWTSRTPIPSPILIVALFLDT